MPQPGTITQHLTGGDLLVLVAPAVDETALHDLHLPAAAEYRHLVSPLPRPRERDTVLLAVQDVLDLRQAVTGMGNIGRARRVAVWFARRPTALPSVIARPEWPALEEAVASRSAGGFMLLTFAAPAPTRSVLLHLARSSVVSDALTVGWPVLGVRRDQPWLWPVADPAATVAPPRRLFDRSVDYPPDVVIVAGRDEREEAFTQGDHPVLGRPPVVSHAEPELSWESLAEMDPSRAGEWLTRCGRSSGPVVDERIFNPVGFDREPLGEPVALRGSHGSVLTASPEATGSQVVADRHGRVSDADLPVLRKLPGLRLEWEGTHGPQSYCRVVASLAAAGVPLVTDHVPEWASPLLSPALVDALRRPAVLTDRLTREEHSVRLRRAALSGHGSRPWRRSLADSLGQQRVPPTTVSVIVATRRPDMLPFTFRQLARQRGVDMEVVLAAHGFDPDPVLLDGFRESTETPLTVLTLDASEIFGAVLNEAATRAEGDVLLKMDDDDWYGPDFAADLLLARDYSGAEIAGCSSEFTFLEPLWLTTRRQDLTEAFRPYVAGGTILIDRGAFRSLGGFRRTRKYVDAALLSGVLDAGGSVYRAQGLGYVLRRGHHGHTWDPGLRYFLSGGRAADQWRGFRPSSLLEADPDDVPVRNTEERQIT